MKVWVDVEPSEFAGSITAFAVTGLFFAGLFALFPAPDSTDYPGIVVVFMICGIAVASVLVAFASYVAGGWMFGKRYVDIEEEEKRKRKG